LTVNVQYEIHTPCVRKGEKGSLVVYANSITKTEQNDAGEDVDREIHFLKGYWLW